MGLENPNCGHSGLIEVLGKTGATVGRFSRCAPYPSSEPLGCKSTQREAGVQIHVESADC